MSTAAIAQGNEQGDGHAAVMVLRAVADGLSDHGLDIRGPEWEDTHQFKVVNVRAALCEVTVAESGAVCWEYRRPERGTAYVTDDSVVRWECRFSDPARGITGFGARDIAATIARSLAYRSAATPVTKRS